MIPLLIAAILSSLAGWLVALWLKDKLKAKDAALEYWKDTCRESQIDGEESFQTTVNLYHDLNIARSEAAVLRALLWIAERKLESTKPDHV